MLFTSYFVRILVVCFFTGTDIVFSTVSVEAGTKVNTYRYGSVYCEFYQCTFTEDLLDFDNATAVAAFNDTLLIQGWGILDIKAGCNSSRSRKLKTDDENTVFGAGYAEGILTSHQINNQLRNFLNIWFPKRMYTKAKAFNALRDWLREQEVWTNKLVLENVNDPFWKHVALQEVWLQGLYEGYKAATQADFTLHEFDWIDFRLLQASGSISDLLEVVKKSNRKNWSKLHSEEILQNMYETSRCSALIKMLPGYEDIFLSHSTWFRYESTARIFKTYDINLKQSGNRRISFSSYGGNLNSVDDFYLVDGKLVVLQTSNAIFYTDLYDLVTPQSLLPWQRVQVANWMAKDGKEWARLFSRHNSGTYNNQYMVLNLHLVQVNKPLKDNTLWVVEQIPGLIESRDLTHVLRSGYFPSYNIPYFDNIFNLSGYPDIVKKVGNDVTYELAPRAKIFRRDQGDVRTLQDMKNLMRYNDYKNDPYSEGNPSFAICSRSDLKEKNPHGCYDTKVTSVSLARQNRADIIGGPTLGTGLPPFSWTGTFARFSHFGLPQTYNFSFISVKPRFDTIT